MKVCWGHHVLSEDEKVSLVRKPVASEKYLRNKMFPIWNVLSFLIYGKFIVLQVEWNLLRLYLGSYRLNLRHFKNSRIEVTKFV